MSTKQESMRKNLGLLSEFVLKLDQAGFKDECYQKVISSKDNILAESIIRVASGNYELVLKPESKSLEFQGKFVISKTKLEKAKVFNQKKKTGYSQYHLSDFKNILLANANRILNSSEMEINEYKLRKNQNDFENRDELGGEKAISIFSYDETLIVLNYVMSNDEYRFGANIVYFMHKDTLHYAHCCWHGAEWFCDARRVHSDFFSAGDNAFSISTIKTEN